jgi:hypothetical protein
MCAATATETLVLLAMQDNLTAAMSDIFGNAGSESHTQRMENKSFDCPPSVRVRGGKASQSKAKRPRQFPLFCLISLPDVIWRTG